MDFSQVIDVLRALERERVRYVLVGGVALNLHGIGRATQDIDLFLAPDADNIERLKRALSSVFNDSQIGGISADELSGPYPTIRYVPPEGSFVVDLMTRLGDAVRYLRRIRWLWAFSERLAPARFPPGLYRYRSIEEAGRARHAWERERVQAIRRSASDAREGSRAG